MRLKTSEAKSIKPFLKKLYLPPSFSHKGQNGKLLIIGGSTLFHAASIWAALTASHFVDMVHYASTVENEEIILSLKKKFINGIVVNKKDLPSYVEEDDAVLIGPGMVRTEGKVSSIKYQVSSIEEISKIKNEGLVTYHLLKYLLHTFPSKRFVIDAGALQMIDKRWLENLKTPPILTPHKTEFERLFGIQIKEKSQEDKMQIVKETAKKYKSVIILKAVFDIISDGDKVIVVEGGNAGLTKGGTGDVLAGLIASFFTKSDPVVSSVMGSFLLKFSSEALFKNTGYWYNIDDIINKLPEALNSLLL